MSSLRLLSLLPLVACTSRINIQRSVRAPHATVPLSSGQPLTSDGELSVGLSNVMDVFKPKVGDEDQAVEVPSTQMRNELRLRTSRLSELALVYEHGFHGTSHRPDPTLPPVGKGDVYGAGVAFRHAFPTSTPGFVIAATAELMGWSLPFVKYVTDADDMTPVSSSRGRDTTFSLGAGVAPSYRVGPVTYFGGLFARTHPTSVRKELNAEIPDDEDPVDSGPLNLLAHAGVEVQLEDWLSASLVVHQDVIASPLRYGPGFGVALNGQFGQ